MSQETQATPQSAAKPSAEKHSPYGKGFMIRMGVLLGILLIAGGLFCYERFVMVPATKAKIDEVFQLMGKHTSDGHGIPSDKVQEILGRAPTLVKTNKEELNRLRKEGEPEMEATGSTEVYEFPRLLPFLKSDQVITVYYRNRAMTQAVRGDNVALTEKLKSDSENVYVPKPEDRQMPTAAAPGS